MEMVMTHVLSLLVRFFFFFFFFFLLLLVVFTPLH